MLIKFMAGTKRRQERLVKNEQKKSVFSQKEEFIKNEEG